MPVAVLASWATSAVVALCIEQEATRHLSLIISTRRSRNRKLPRRLFLLVKGLDGNWQFPQSDRLAQETMRQAATRSLQQCVGTASRNFFVGFCPMAYWDTGSGESQRRLFFYKCQIIEGELELSPEHATDYVSRPSLLTCKPFRPSNT